MLLTPVIAMPVGIIRPFWLPAMVTSMPQASILYSMLPSEEIVSESSSAGCLAWSIARRTSASGSDHAGRGLVVDGEHGLDLVALVGGEALA